MTPATLLNHARADGVELVIEPPDQIKVRGPADARAKWLPVLRPHKAALVRLLSDPLSAQDKTLVTAALDRLGEADPQTRAEVLDRCAADPGARAFWTARAPEPDPWTDIYRRWLAGITEPRVLVTLDEAQVREAVAAGVVSRETAGASVLLLVRSPSGDLGPGAVGLLAITRARWAEFSPTAAVEALAWAH